MSTNDIIDATICVWGDSITMWFRDLEKWWRVNRLQTYLWERFLQWTGDYHAVYNLWIDGDTSAGVLQRFLAEANTRCPSIIMFALWANDCVYFDDGKNIVPLNEFKKNIIELIRLAKPMDVPIVFVWLIPCDEGRMMPMSRASDLYQDMKNTLLYDATIGKICEQEKVLFIDMMDVLSWEELQDGSHPTAQGHEKMYIRIRDFLLDKKII